VASKSSLTVEGVLKAVTPKHQEGDQWVGGRNVPKGNTLDLLISVRIPAPKPPKAYDRWKNDEGRDWDVDRKITAKQNELQKQLDAAAAGTAKDPKPPRGGHWFKPQPEESATEEKPAGVCTGHPKCGNLAFDGVKCHELPAAPSTDELKAQLQAELAAFIAGFDVERAAKYNRYVAECNEQTQKAMLASLGSGMFFALLGQEVKVDFAPSDRVFQPMLEAAKSLPGMMVLADVAAPPVDVTEAPSLTMGSNASADDDDEDDEDEDRQLVVDDEEEE